MNRTIVVAGATSKIAHETLREFAKPGDRLFLIARDENKLNSVVADLKARGVHEIHPRIADLADPSVHAALLNEAQAKLGSMDVLFVAYGIFSEPSKTQDDAKAVRKEIETNFTSTVLFLTHFAPIFEAQRRGTIAVISSVAGDRGRQSNYVYGSTKAGVSAFLQGLRNRLYPAGVRVLTIKPGIIDTPMTATLSKRPLLASAARAGKDISQALERGKDVLYTPWYWACIMRAVRLLPEAIFKRLRL